MTHSIEIKVPDIGNFRDVEIIDVLVKSGDKLVPDQGLVTLETDKAAMDVPSPYAGTVKDVRVNKGDRVSQGTLVLILEVTDAPAVAAPQIPRPASTQGATERRVLAPGIPGTAIGGADYSGKVDAECEVLVLGSGPGGYTAAFRAADLGRQVVLVERYPALGGVCLNVGCIPSKALLHAARVIEEAEAMANCGIRFGKATIETEQLRAWKNRVVGKLTGGLVMLAKQRKVRVVTGFGKFLSPHHLAVDASGDARTAGREDGDDREGRKVLRFEQCIIAAGSQATRIPGVPDDPRILDATSALELEVLPERMLVIGGGIIGLEMACVYDALGVKITVVELTDTLIPEADRDLIRVLQKRIERRYEKILLGVKVSKLEAVAQGLHATFESHNGEAPETYGRVLVAVGRRPNGGRIDADKAGVTVDGRGFIPVDRQQRTNVPHIFAIGDIAGNPMLAHKASHEGRVAAEVAAGLKVFNDARAIPSVAYTDPEVAWVGLTEKQAKDQGIEIGKGVFPWSASGRALSLGRDDGMTKLLFDVATGRVLGAGIVGVNAGDLIAEMTLAIEMGCDAADIGLTIHPHPTLSETVMLAAEAFDGTLTDLYLPRQH